MAAQPIQAAYVSLLPPGQLGHGQAFYSMPPYQRPYQWTTEYATQLARDLFASFENARPRYFIGTLILQAQQQPPAFVPAQHRGTTWWTASND
jgi:hypothetical protein